MRVTQESFHSLNAKNDKQSQMLSPYLTKHFIILIIPFLLKTFFFWKTVANVAAVAADGDDGDDANAMLQEAERNYNELQDALLDDPENEELKSTSQELLQIINTLKESLKV